MFTDLFYFFSFYFTSILIICCVLMLRAHIFLCLTFLHHFLSRAFLKEMFKCFNDSLLYLWVPHLTRHFAHELICIFEWIISWCWMIQTVLFNFIIEIGFLSESVEWTIQWLTHKDSPCSAPEWISFSFFSWTSYLGE